MNAGTMFRASPLVHCVNGKRAFSVEEADEPHVDSDSDYSSGESSGESSDDEDEARPLPQHRPQPCESSTEDDPASMPEMIVNPMCEQGHNPARVFLAVANPSDVPLVLRRGEAYAERGAVPR
jgi:hypothetical protein